MNVSQYVLYVPYRVAWGICRAFRREPLVVFYCGSYVDYIVFREVHKRLPQTKVVAKNRTVQRELQRGGVNASLYPSFPDVVIMARHVARKFPEPRMKRIGMRHGAYHFKNFVSADRYNAFDIYFVTSRREAELARAWGITTACAGGFPKLDPAFNGSITAETLNAYRQKLGIEADRSTVIFTTTWDTSGSSAIERWIDRLPELGEDYHVLVTVHHWVSRRYKDRLKRMSGISYIEDKDILPYLMVSDVMIGDSSSIIAEFCALDKPIITFRVPQGRRWSAEIEEMLNKMTVRIDTFDELKPAIEESLANPDALSSERKNYTRMMFDNLDGKHAERIVKILKERFPRLV